MFTSTKPTPDPGVAPSPYSWTAWGDALHAAVTAQTYRIFRPEEYGAIGDGTTDDTAAFAQAAAAMVAAGSGVLQMSARSYKVTALPTFTPRTASGPLTYAVRGLGRAVSRILHFGTSPDASLTVQNTAFTPDAGSTGAPAWGGFTIDGAGSSGGCSGIRWGDISYPTFTDIDVRNFTTGDGWLFSNAYGWTEGVHMLNCGSQYNAVQLRYDVGSGRQLGTITTALASGTSYQTIAVAGGLSSSLYVGQSITIAAAPSAVGVFTQTVVVTEVAAVGAQTISVQPFTAGAAFPAGTARVHFGGFGSFDYWNVLGLYIQGRANQHGIVSERSRGLGERVDRLGSVMMVKGNFRADTTNSGIVLWLKGPQDTWNDTTWMFSVETGGTGVAHKSIQLDVNTSSIGGSGGLLRFYGCETATLQLYQWNYHGRATVKGVTGPNALDLVTMRQPGRSNVAGGVRPAGYQTSLTPDGTGKVVWQNTTGYDLLVTVPVTFTGAGTAKATTDVYNGLPAAASTQAAAGAGVTVPLTFIHHADAWARIDVTNATLGAPSTSYA